MSTHNLTTGTFRIPDDWLNKTFYIPDSPDDSPPHISTDNGYFGISDGSNSATFEIMPLPPLGEVDEVEVGATQRQQQQHEGGMFPTFYPREDTGTYGQTHQLQHQQHQLREEIEEYPVYNPPRQLLEAPRPPIPRRHSFTSADGRVTITVNGRSKTSSSRKGKSSSSAYSSKKSISSRTTGPGSSTPQLPPAPAESTHRSTRATTPQSIQAPHPSRSSHSSTHASTTSSAALARLTAANTARNTGIQRELHPGVAHPPKSAHTTIHHAPSGKAPSCTTATARTARTATSSSHPPTTSSSRAPDRESRKRTSTSASVSSQSRGRHSTRPHLPTASNTSRRSNRSRSRSRRRSNRRRSQTRSSRARTTQSAPQAIQSSSRTTRPQTTASYQDQRARDYDLVRRTRAMDLANGGLGAVPMHGKGLTETLKGCLKKK